jgi:uncharacterized phiE125 gp8 family phage protein
MNLEITVAPTSEPFDLDNSTGTGAKNWLKVVDDDDDGLIEALIKASREQFEHKTGRTALTTTYTAYFDRFRGRIINLEKPPLQTVTSVKYLNKSSVWTTILSTWYRVEAKTDSGAIILLDDYEWPTDLLDGPNVIEVVYVAGYATAAAMPETSKQWMKCLVTDMYENRQSDTPSTVNQHKFIDGLLDSLIVPWRFIS